MRLIFSFLILISFSCSSQNDIAEFERILGKKESNTLTQLVKNFENEFLIKKFPDLNINEKYINLLKELNKEGRLLYWKDISNESYELYKSSKLWDEIFSYPGKKVIYDANRFEINPFGKYAKALNSIDNKSTFLKQYIDQREASGGINPSIFIINILNSKVDFEDYFIKRLIITELVH